MYEALCRSPELAWISNFSQRVIALSFLSRPALAGSKAARLAGRRLAIYPVEGYAAYDRIRPHDNIRALGKEDCTNRELVELRELVSRHAGRSRVFLNNNTRNSRRNGYLVEAFPNARFIHVIRDPYAVVRSLSKVAFWPSIEVWWEPSAPQVQDVVSSESESLILAANFWRHEVGQCLHDLEDLGDRCLQLQYEDLLQDPSATLTRALSFVTGVPSTVPESASASIIRPVRAERSEIPRNVIEEISGAVEPLASKLGYEKPGE